MRTYSYVVPCRIIEQAKQSTSTAAVFTPLEMLRYVYDYCTRTTM